MAEPLVYVPLGGDNKIVAIDREGNIHGRYRKMHLFDIDLPDPGTATATVQVGRTVRSDSFWPMLSRIREVLDLDPAAVW